MGTADGGIARIVKLRVAVSGLVQMFHALLRVRAQIIKPAKNDRLGGTHFCAGRDESAFLSIITKSALKCAACIGKRLGPAIDHPERAGDDAIPTAIADVILHENRTDFRAHDRACWTRFEAAGFFAMLANIGEKNPAEWILAIAIP